MGTLITPSSRVLVVELFWLLGQRRLVHALLVYIKGMLISAMGCMMKLRLDS
jgi:hypothetical protein